MTTITAPQIETIARWYNTPDQPEKIPFYDIRTAEKLKENGYIEDTPNWKEYKLTSKGREYIANLRNHIDHEQWSGLKSDERNTIVRQLLDTKNPTHIHMLFNLMKSDRSDKVRESAAARLCAARQLKQADWNDMAHNSSETIRIIAVGRADIEEYRQERSANVVKRLVHDQSKPGGIPGDIVRGWFKNGISDSIEAMTAKDIDLVLETGTSQDIDKIVTHLGQQFTPQQIRRVATLLDERPGNKNLERALWELCNKAEHVPDDVYRKQQATKFCRVLRLDDYRDAYRKFKKLERMFEENSEFKREQERIAMEEMA